MRPSLDRRYFPRSLLFHRKVSKPTPRNHGIQVNIRTEQGSTFRDLPATCPKQTAKVGSRTGLSMLMSSARPHCWTFHRSLRDIASVACQKLWPRTLAHHPIPAALNTQLLQVHSHPLRPAIPSFVFCIMRLRCWVLAMYPACLILCRALGAHCGHTCGYLRSSWAWYSLYAAI